MSDKKNPPTPVNRGTAPRIPVNNGASPKSPLAGSSPNVGTLSPNKPMPPKK